MRITVLALLAFIITACSSTPIDSYHEAEFGAIVQEFEQTCGVEVQSSVMFLDIERPAIGLCYMGRYTVFIDKKFWMVGSTPEERFTLIMHELGHCDLHRPHETDNIVMKIDGQDQVMPKSIMNPYVFPIPDYPGIKEYYMKELCGN